MASISGSGSAMTVLFGGPVDVAPVEFVSAADRARLLAAVLAGIPLGAWDRRIIAWLAGWDAETVLTVASLISRARAAGAPIKTSDSSEAYETTGRQSCDQSGPLLPGSTSPRHPGVPTNSP
jgi:hypothetical protein